MFKITAEDIELTKSSSLKFFKTPEGRPLFNLLLNFVLGIDSDDVSDNEIESYSNKIIDEMVTKHNKGIIREARD